MNFRIAVLFLFILGWIHGNCHAQEVYLKIQGADSISSHKIDSLGYKKVFENLLGMNQELDSLTRRLQRIGYIENQFGEIKKINDSTYGTTIDLKQYFDTIYIYYTKTTLNPDDLKIFSEEITDAYFTVPIQQLESVLTGLNNKLANQGQPFLELQLTDIGKRDENNLSGQLEVRLKMKRKIDKIVIRGYEKFPKSFLKHMINIRTGMEYNLGDIRTKSEELSNLRFANQVRPPETLFTSDSTTLYFYVEKTKSNSFDGFLGFGTNEETNKLQFDGYLNLNLVNSLNFGETLQLNYKSDENDQQTLNLRTQLPYLFKSPIGVDLKLNIFKKDSTFTTVSQSADLYYQLKANKNLYAGISAVQSNDLLDESRTEVGDLNSTFANLKYEWVRPDVNSLLFPVSFNLLAGIGIGQRKTDSTSVAQQRFELNVFKIFKLNDRNSIFLRLLSAGLLSDDYYDNELLRFGGINNIRGFEENTLVGSLYGILNSEYRYQLSNTIYIHTIVDAAYLENDLIKSREKLFGYGFGFGLLTRAGLLRFNYANGKFDGQKFKLANSKIHISLNASF